MSLAKPNWLRRPFRWLLELDKPVPDRTPDELAAVAQKDYRWNFVVNLLDGAAFWFGLSFISGATILPLFVSKLTTDPFWIALLAVLSSAAWYLPQIFAASSTERLNRKKPVVVNLGFFTERLPIWLMPVAALLAAVNPTAALILFFVAYAWHGFGAGAIAPAWSDMIANCFPVDRRGWLFGLTAFIGTGLGALGAIFSGWLLVTYPFPVNFAYAFLVAAIAITASWFFLALTREPVYKVAKTVPSELPSSWSKTVAIVRGDHNFRNFLNARSLMNLSRMGAGFLTVAAVTQWQTSDGVVGLFTAAMLIGQTVANLGAGMVADRWGHKLSLELGLWASTIAFLLAWWAPTEVWYYAVFFLIGAAGGVNFVSGVLVVMEFSTPEHRPTYIGIGNTASGITSAIAPLIGGVLALLGYNWLFAVSVIVGLIAIAALHFTVREPRHQTEQFEV